MRYTIIALVAIVLFSSGVSAQVETVGSDTYTWVAVKSDPDVFLYARSALEKAGFDNTGDIPGPIDLPAIAEKFWDNYGGVL